jgi:hypothetical protein
MVADDVFFCLGFLFGCAFIPQPDSSGFAQSVERTFKVTVRDEHSVSAESDLLKREIVSSVSMAQST